MAYTISGSEPTMLWELAFDHASPLFQHFDVISIGPLPRVEASGQPCGTGPPGGATPHGYSVSGTAEQSQEASPAVCSMVSV